MEREKITPDQWDFIFSVDKKRAGQAPEGSGVPVGRVSLVYACPPECKKGRCK
jgi:hypothetical protein